MQESRAWLKWHSWLGQNHRGWRLFAAIVCVISLALFLHFREVRLETFELNAAAGHYVVAQVDFEFPDYEATLVLKQQAVKDIGRIYELDEKQVREARHALEDRLIHSKGWRQAAPRSTFEEMYKMADELESLLLEARFTDPRTLQEIRHLGLPETPYFELVPEEMHTLPSDFWGRISTELLQNGVYSTEAVRYMLNLFEARHWTFVEDVSLEHSLRAQVSRQVPEKFTHVQAGTRILDQGERVTSRHLTMMQAMKQTISEGRRLWEPLTWVASFILSIIFITISALYFRINQLEFIRSLRKISLFICIVILTLLFAKLVEYALLKNSSSILDAVHYPIVAPFATMLICILLSPRTALYAATLLSIILSVSLAVDHSRFLILNLVTSIAVIIGSRNLRKRKEVFAVCMKSWLSAIPVLYAFTLSENRLWTATLLPDILSSLVFFVITAVLVIGLLPALEMIFGVLTDMSLIEYTDPSSELLRSFAAAVPGTYQHSLVLGNLAETCAQAIGANGLFCRAATLYHDIGKMNNPQFYTENQQGMVNVHQLLTPLESAQVIISHVTDGVEIARKNHLPEPFINIIREHHGTTLVYYFYRKQLELKGGRKEEVNEKEFRYPGPKPRTKESAIIMICDTIEATSRSLEEYSEATLWEMVNRLVAEKSEDGQFDDCKLTFEELTQVKTALVKTLLIAHHVRVKYPKKEK